MQVYSRGQSLSGLLRALRPKFKLSSETGFKSAVYVSKSAKLKSNTLISSVNNPNNDIKNSGYRGR